MRPILFSIGPVSVFSYGLLLGLAFIFSLYLAGKRAHIYNIPKEPLSNLFMIFILFGILGARIFYIFINIKYFAERPFEVFYIHRGGLVFQGGFIAAFIAGVVYLKIRKIPIVDTCDLVAPFIALGHAIGRIGCFLNGCCYGKPTDSFLGVTFPLSDVKVFPTQLFEAAGLMGIFAILFYAQKKRSFRGQIILLYIIIYGVLRFLMDFLRGDLYPVWLGMTISQLVSAGLFIIGTALYAARRVRS